MTLQLFNLVPVPSWVPPWHALIEDLGRPPAKRLAKVLGLGLRTVRRYNQTGDAPKAVLLALFWLTRWGRLTIHAQATNDAMVACGYLRSLQDEVRRLEGQIRYLLALGNAGAANEPLLRGMGACPHG